MGVRPGPRARKAWRVPVLLPHAAAARPWPICLNLSRPHPQLRHGAGIGPVRGDRCEDYRDRGWSPSAQAAAAGGAGRQPSSGLSSGARDLVRLGRRAATCVFFTQRVSQGCRFQQWPAVAAACGVGPRGGAVAGRAWRALFYSRGGEGAKTETRESRTDLKGKDAFP